MKRILGSILLLVLGGGAIHATTYVPVTFDELVTKADVIFVGEVTDVRPVALQTREGTLIQTRVVFRVLDPIAGTSSALEVFEFLGGEVGGVRMAIPGMPTFAIGDRRLMFARRDRSINPIVGFTQGLFQITRDSGGTDRVLLLDGTPLERPDLLGTRSPAGRIGAIPVTLASLRTRVTAVLVRGGRR